MDAVARDLSSWLGLSFSVRERVALPLPTLSNLLAALREGDYSIRAINLPRNAIDARQENNGPIHVRWSASGGPFQLPVEDEGPGLPQTANLFVPFFTTKAGVSEADASRDRALTPYRSGLGIIRYSRVW